LPGKLPGKLPVSAGDSGWPLGEPRMAAGGSGQREGDSPLPVMEEGG
jgi:hypothetical protein